MQVHTLKVSNLTLSTDVISRQAARKELRDFAKEQVDSELASLPRSQRRQLARAIVKQALKERE